MALIPWLTTAVIYLTPFITAKPTTNVGSKQHPLGATVEAEHAASDATWYVDDGFQSFKQHGDAAYPAYLASLSPYGDPSILNGQRNASVWLKSAPKNQQVVLAGYPLIEYLDLVDADRKLGYAPTLITCSGPSGNTSCSGAVEIPGNNTYELWCEMSEQDFEDHNYAFWTQQLILNSFTEHGDLNVADGRRYCAIWLPNPNHAWSPWPHSMFYDDYVSVFNAQVTKPYWRPGAFAISTDQRISATFVDTYVGEWFSLPDMDAATLRSTDAASSSRGLEMIHLQGNIDGNDTSFAAIWTEKGLLQPRQWTVNGATTGFDDNDAVSSSIDGMMQGLLAEDRCPTGSSCGQQR